jgi:cytosine/adenosine deaminase-related metal-dependent hydrolase
MSTRTALLFAAAFFVAACATAPAPESPVSTPQGDGRIAIGGHIVTPTGVLRDSWIVVENGRIAAIQKERPAVASAIETKDYVFPGFVDLHNHPLYNLLPRWAPPQHYVNRYEWRNDPVYRAAVAPQAAALRAGFCDVDAYVELKMLMGGTTSTIGISKPSTMPAMDRCITGLARNLDWHTGFHGEAPGNEPVMNLIGITPGDLRDLKPADVAAKLRKGDLDLLAIHIAEGKASDAQTKGEFAMLEAGGLVTSRTAVIHGIALTDADYAKMAAAGSALVWSPRSNFVLYGETADVPAALRHKVTVALAPDWGPTGSDNLLDEIAFAATISRSRMANAISSKQLFEMATSVPAKIARIDQEVGSLVVGLRADLFLLKSGNPDAYNALVQTGASGIEMVLVNGVPIYGDAGYLKALDAGATEALTVCGASKAVSSRALSQGSLADLTARLHNVMAASGSSLMPLVELCR